MSFVVRRTPRAVRSLGLTLSASMLLGACSDNPTAVLADPPRPKQTLMCVRESAVGGAPEIQAYDPAAGCPDGFDLKIWY